MIKLNMGGGMELIRQFNSELSSICEGRPSISKAKMASITRIAVKALKHYKHVVHSVEKFLQKCCPEYKIAALYVLDSIIRQSRHQFGHDKDLFGPRFQKNIKFLFQNIFQCPHEDKPKVVRVLNLWQKNGIYSPEVISPLIDMASTSSKVLAAAVSRHKKAKAAHNSTYQLENSNFMDDIDPQQDEIVMSEKGGIQMSQEDEIKVLKAQLDQQKKHQELLQQQLQMQVMATKQQNLQIQLQQQTQIQPNPVPHPNIATNAFNTILNLPPQQMAQLHPLLTHLLTSQPTVNPQVNILSHIQELTNQLEKDKVSLAPLQNIPEHALSSSNEPTNPLESQSQFLENFQQLIQTAKGFIQKDPRQQTNPTHNADEIKADFKPALLGNFDYNEEESGMQILHKHQRDNDYAPARASEIHKSSDFFQQEPCEVPPQKKPLLDFYEEQKQQQKRNDNEHRTYEEDDDAMQIEDEDEFYLEKSSEVRQRASRWQPEVGMHTDEEKRRQDENRMKEEELKREKEAMPPPVNNRVTVASVTLWIGRLPKNCYPELIQDSFSQYGEIKSIDLIDARGCAFVTMRSRRDADRALRHLKHKRMDGYDVKMAWGQAKGIQPFSKYWDESFGCAYVPCELVKEDDLRSLMNGSIIDEDTLPRGIKLPYDPPVSEENPFSAPPNPLEPSIHPFLLPPGAIPPPGLLPPGFRAPFPPIHQMLNFRPPPPHPGGMQPLGRPPLLPRTEGEQRKPLFNQFRPSALPPRARFEHAFPGRERMRPPLLHDEPRRPPGEPMQWFMQPNRFNGPHMERPDFSVNQMNPIRDGFDPSIPPPANYEKRDELKNSTWNRNNEIKKLEKDENSERYKTNFKYRDSESEKRDRSKSRSDRRNDRDERNSRRDRDDCRRNEHRRDDGRWNDRSRNRSPERKRTKNREEKSPVQESFEEEICLKEDEVDSIPLAKSPIEMDNETPEKPENPATGNEIHRNEPPFESDGPKPVASPQDVVQQVQEKPDDGDDLYDPLAECEDSPTTQEGGQFKLEKEDEAIFTEQT